MKLPSLTKKTEDTAVAEDATSVVETVAPDKDAQPEPRRPETLPTEVDAAVVEPLTALLAGPWRPLREKLSAFGEDPSLYADPDRTMAEHREATFENLFRVLETGGFQAGFSQGAGGEDDVAAGTLTLAALAAVDGSLAIKSGVQWGLWGGALDQLGTERHKDWARKASSLELPGCFAMTEHGHGSDVQSLQTTATYDPETAEFIIHTPDEAAVKNYIGNAARHGRAAVVFAQLYTPENPSRSNGVHALIVPIRDEQGNALPGVTIGDHGHKGGLLGVDNGTLAFDQVRIPRENLLNRFADVAEDGSYHSPIASDNARFFTMLGTLIRGRVGVAGAAIGATEAALSISLRYAARRRQFAGIDGTEKRLIEHRAHRRRLIIPLARTVALHLLHNQVLERYREQIQAQADGSWSLTEPTEEQKFAAREMESLAAAVKVAATEHATDTIQEAREACGGAGYMSENRLVTLKADSDVYATFEGDNTVLVQMVGKNLLTAYGREMSDLSPWDMAKYAATTASDVVRRRTGFTRRLQSIVDLVSDAEAASLFDASYQAKLIDDRSHSVLRSLVRRMQVARKAEPEEAGALVDQAQDHLIAAGWARIDVLLIQALIEAEESLTPGSTERKVIEQLRDLYAFDTIVRHAGWYQEHNLLTAGRVKAARAAINDLVDSLAPWSEVILDAFGLPQQVHNVPLLNSAGVDPR